MGGEEFVLLPNTSQEGVKTLAEQIRKKYRIFEYFSSFR
jgi:GGDEF domain-containing protein